MSNIKGQEQILLNLKKHHSDEYSLDYYDVSELPQALADAYWKDHMIAARPAIVGVMSVYPWDFESWRERYLKQLMMSDVKVKQDMTNRTIILKRHDRELPVDIIVDELSKTIHLKVEWIDTQLLTGLVQDELSRLGGEYKIWLHTINRGVEIGNERCEAMIEICEATFTVEPLKDTLIIRPLERSRYD